MATYYIVLCVHIVGATIWAGGHLVLTFGILPGALREGRSAAVSDFEQRFERIGLSALGAQIITGLWLAHNLLGSPDNWLKSDPVARSVQLKFALLAVTLGFALHARLRVVPALTDATLSRLAWHIRIVTVTAVLLVLTGVTIRFGGYPAFDR